MNNNKMNGINKYLKSNPKDSVICVYNDLGLIVVGYEGQDTYEKVGCINFNGDIVIPKKYIGTIDFHEGLAVVYNESMYCGYIDTSGNEVIPFGKYTYGTNFENGIAAVCNFYDKWGYINTNGEEIIECYYDSLDDLKINGLSSIKRIKLTL